MDELLDLIGKFLVKQIREEILTPRARFTKTGAPKVPPRYNFNASGSLYKSVEYKIVDEDIIILMNDYGVDYVFGGGSKPKRPAPVAPIEKWVKAKIGLSGAAARSMAFAVSKNLSKVGYKGLPLLTQDLQEETFQYVNKLLEQPRFQELVVEDIFDKIKIFGFNQYNIAIS